jgi:eukaryotic-like serine/threonine-protein kinase
VQTGGLQQRLLGERFEIVAQLGAGAMGDVYRARDRARGLDVALKVLPELDATALLRFKNEFRALHDVQHPNLVRLHELHEDHGTWFITMQLVDGVDLLSWIDGDEGRLRAVLPQVAQALHRLHCDGLVHRDVKSSNVLVTASGRAMLLDFGLVAPTWSPGEGAGTPSYMAPEQVAGDISPAADWYAFGVLLFRALTGAMPFVGSPEAVMQAKAERPAPHVRDLQARAPLDLATLADSLLERRPQDRPSGDAVLATLGVGGQPTQFARSIVIGRDRELAELRQAVTDRIAGNALAVAVIGESGIGKTTLLRAFAEDVEQSGVAWVLSGRCWERELVPYKGFDGVIDELASRLDAEDWELPDAGWSAILVQAFPVLRRVRGFAERAPYGDVTGHETAARVSTGLRWLLSEVAARQPLVIVIDDLQWADRDTLALLRALLEPPLPNVLLGFGAREPVVLDEQTAVRTIALAPLSDGDTATLVDVVVRELGGNVDAAAIAREAGGHPLFAAELARHVVATGELAPISFEDVVRRLTDRFGDEAKRIATIVSVAHAPLSIEATAHAARAGGPTFFDALATLRSAQLVATSGAGNDTRIEPYHDRIRRTLVDQVPPPELADAHGRIAQALEATGSSDHAALAMHWEQASQPQHAARHALRAAEQAEAAFAFHRAARLYTWVLALDPQRTAIRVRMAESLAQAGLGVNAAEAFLACARDASGAEALDLRRRAMQQLLLMGHNDRALALLDELMRWLDLPNPTKPRRIMLSLLRSRAAIRLHRAVLRPPTTVEPPLFERVRLDVLWDAAAGLAFVDPLRSFYFHSLNLELCFRTQDGPRLARGLLGEAPYLAASGKSTRRLRRCIELADQAAARVSFAALPSLARGTVAFLFGHWRVCRESLAECERLLQQDRPRLVKEGFGPAQLTDATRRLQLAAMFYLGQLKPVRRRVAELLQDAMERNDVTSATHLRSGVQGMLFLAFGEVDTARRNAEEGFRPWRESRVGVPHFMDLQARSMIDVYVGDGLKAHRGVLAEWPRFEQARLMTAQYIRVSLLDTRGRTALAAALAATGDERRAALADAKRCADKLEATGAGWGAPLGSAVRAGVALALRDDASARAYLERAATSFTAADMALHAANARMVRAVLVGDTETATAERRVLADAGVVDIERYSRLLLPRA